MTVHEKDIVDLQFSLSGRAVPADYAELLWQELIKVLPWLEHDDLTGVHPISGLSRGVDEWYLSRRSHLTLRLPRQQADAAAVLAGARLVLAGHQIVLGRSVLRPLANTPVIYAKFVAMSPASDVPIDEAGFHSACQLEFERLGIRPKMICGKAQRIQTSGGLLSGFSLMLYELEDEANLKLQYEGLGIGRRHGCGIFVPHKSGAALER